MAHRDIIVIGASVGGVESLSRLVQDLPADLRAAVLIVLHVAPTRTSVLPHILTRAGSLQACHPNDGDEITPGKIYIAPADRHMAVESGRIRLTRGPRENGHRPAVDVLFRTAARTYGPRVIGVVLSGSLDDGVEGLLQIKSRSGIAVVQDPESAVQPGMPQSAIEHVAVDHIVDLSEMGPLLVQLTRDSEEVDSLIEKELSSAPGRQEEEDDVPVAGVTCPECRAPMVEVQEGDLLRFRCRLGHLYSPGSLVAVQSDDLETALWTALRALEDSARVAYRLAQSARESDRRLSASNFLVHAKEADARAEVIRRVLTQEMIQSDNTEKSAEASDDWLQE